MALIIPCVQKRYEDAAKKNFKHFKSFTSFIQVNLKKEEEKIKFSYLIL